MAIRPGPAEGLRTVLGSLRSFARPRLATQVKFTHALYLIGDHIIPLTGESENWLSGFGRSAYGLRTRERRWSTGVFRQGS